MRFPLNLARAPSFRERYGLWVAVPGFLLVLALLGWLSLSTLSNFRRLRGVDRGLDALQSRRQDLRRDEDSLRRDLAEPEARQLIHEAGYVNRLIQARKFSVADLTLKVSKLMPPNVRLDSLGLVRPGERPLIRFAVEGKTSLDIEAFLKQIENSDDFSDIIVTSQGYSGNGSGSPALATCTAFYMDGAMPKESDTEFDADSETTINSTNR